MSESLHIESKWIRKHEARDALIERFGDYTRYISQFLNKEYILDQGGAAYVFTIKDAGICCKMVKRRELSPNRDNFKIANIAEVEARYQVKFSDIESEYGRSPQVVDLLDVTDLDTKEQYAIILMEELDAVNLQHIFNRSADAPEEMNDEFIDDVESFIFEAHDRGLFHGDLYARNVMVDRKTGKPRIIDFGNAGQLGSGGKDRGERMDEELLEVLHADFEVFKSRVKIAKRLKVVMREVQGINPQFKFRDELFNVALVKRAQEEIKSSLAKGVTSGAIPVGESSIFYSEIPEEIIGTTEINIDGRIFYVGFQNLEREQAVN